MGGEGGGDASAPTPQEPPASPLAKGPATPPPALAPLSPGRRSEHVEAAVLRAVAELTGGAPSEALGAGTPLMEAGIDSLAATELSSRLRALTGVPVSPTVVFEHPTPRAIAAHLLESAADGGAAAPRLMIRADLALDHLAELLHSEPL